MWKRERQRPKERGAIFLLQSKIVVCAPVCCVKMEWMTACPCCPVLAAQHRSDSLPRPASYSTEDISLAFSSLAASFSRSLSFIPLTRTHETHHTLALVMLARLYLLCKVRCKVLHCLSFLLGKELWTWDLFIGLRMFGTHISFLFLD